MAAKYIAWARRYGSWSSELTQRAASDDEQISERSQTGSQSEGTVMTTITLSDRDILNIVSWSIGIGAEELLRRYYGSPGDARHELEELDRTGHLQASLALLLRKELSASQAI